MKPTAPKILPWLAHKAGLPLPRAERLWQAACHHAAHATGETGTPAFWSAALDRLLTLVAAESLREDAASWGWRPITRTHARLWQPPLAMLDTLTLASQRFWRSFETLIFG